MDFFSFFGAGNISRKGCQSPGRRLFQIERGERGPNLPNLAFQKTREREDEEVEVLFEFRGGKAEKIA